ncbi:MAG: aldehyde dehydrogenase family protein, partial [Vampirovibrionia bacterium]
GSTEMGRKINISVAERLGRTLLELGGNNAIIITEDANLDMALQATLFGAVGTAGQRCTSTRRIIIHNSIKEKFVNALVNAYKKVNIGNPLEKSTLMGPLVDNKAVDEMMSAIEEVKSVGGKVLYGGEKLSLPQLEGGFYVQPTIVEANNDYDVVQRETFAPILYIIGYNTIEEAIEIHNDVPQGLSSSIFTNSIHDSELFLSSQGSDCGIANVNIGTSGAEIGGAFGGEKETGGGRESGSDSWKIYMRRQTNTINWGKEIPLAQGIEFKVD